MTIKSGAWIFCFLLLCLLGVWCDIAAAEADGPDYWAVHGVSHGAVLNLRKGPTIQFPVLARIPAGYAHLENLSCSPEFTMQEWTRFTEPERDLAVSLRWCRVRYEEQTGWVKGTYLQEGRPPEE